MEVRQVVHEAEGVSKVLTGDLGGRRRGDIVLRPLPQGRHIQQKKR